MRRYELTVVLLISGACSTAANAASLEAYSGVIAGANECPGGAAPANLYAFFGNPGFGIGTGGNGISDCGLSGGINDIVQAAGPAMSAFQLNYPGDAAHGFNATYTGSGQATTNHGSISTSISGALSGPDPANGVAESVAFGIAGDSWNVGGGSGSGYAALTFTLDAEGSLTSPVSGTLETEVEVQVGSGPPERIFFGEVGTGFAAAFGVNLAALPGCTTTTTSYLCTNAAISTVMLPVTFGTVMPFNWGIIIAAQPGGGVSVDPSIGLTGIQIYNANGQPVPNFTITSGSGTVYGANGIVSQPGGNVPEPSTFLLMAGALMAFGCSPRARHLLRR
jgi:PEP-CTERM motif